MTLPVSGAISFNNINVELGVAGTTQASLGQASYRTLAGVPSGAISMSNFYGKSNTFSFTISTNQTNANLRSLAVAAGWNQSANVQATINSGVTVYSTSTGTPALTVNGSWPAGVTLINNGTILGRGGNGGGGGTAYPWANRTNGGAGTAGGLGLSVSVALSVNNVGRISGGGGGGGGGGAATTSAGKIGSNYAAGGGGGGGINFGSAGGGGYGGGGSQNGSSGSAGTLTANGSGGSGATYSTAVGGPGGAGGSYGATGATGTSGNAGPGTSGGSGGAAGGAVSGNANITWIATGTRNGGIS